MHFFTKAVVASLSLLSLVGASPVASPAENLDSPSSVLSGLGVDSSLASQSTQRTGNAGFTCQVFQLLFPKNGTFTAKSEYYENLYEIPWSQRCWLKPACVVTPTSSQDLSKIMKVVSVLKTKFAVRSGGHTLVPGWNAIGSDGILIALQNTNTLSISSDAKTITAGTGNRWKDVYNFAAKNNKMIVGGREPQVGVGGFLLGGGLSAFYNTVGLGMDNVSKYTVVLTDGSIVTASASKNKDLYLALKGGLTNMGIVTEFELITNDYLDVYVEIHLYNATTTPAVLTAYANYLANPKIDPLSQVAVQVRPGFTLGFYGYTGKANRPAIFNEFYKIPVMQTFSPPTNSTILNLVNGFYAGAVSPGNSYSSTFSHKVPNDKLFLDSYKIYKELLATLPAGVGFDYQPQGVSANIIKAGKERSPDGNLLGIWSGPQAWVDISTQAADSNLISIGEKAVDTFVERVTALSKNQGVHLPYQYVNNANSKLKPLKSFGEQNFRTIEKAAKKWDPRGVMQKLQGNGYLVSNQ